MSAIYSVEFSFVDNNNLDLSIERVYLVLHGGED